MTSVRSGWPPMTLLIASLVIGILIGAAGQALIRDDEPEPELLGGPLSITEVSPPDITVNLDVFNIGETGLNLTEFAATGWTVGDVASGRGAIIPAGEWSPLTLDLTAICIAEPTRQPTLTMTTSTGSTATIDLGDALGAMHPSVCPDGIAAPTIQVADVEADRVDGSLHVTMDVENRTSTPGHEVEITRLQVTAPGFEVIESEPLPRPFLDDSATIGMEWRVADCRLINPVNQHSVIARYSWADSWSDAPLALPPDVIVELGRLTISQCR